MFASSVETCPVDAGTSRGLWFWLGLLTLAALWPFLVFERPEFQDLANHLARAFILLNADDPVLRANYEVVWESLPNLSWDVFAVVLGRVLPLMLTAKIFVVLSWGLTLGGVFALNRVLAGRWTWTPLLAVPLLFHTGYTKGFLAFSFGLGVCMLASALWQALGEERWRLRLVLATMLSTLLYFSHFFAWGIYGLFVLGHKITLLRREPLQRVQVLFGMVRDGVQAVPPLGFFLLAGRMAEKPTGLNQRLDDFDWPIVRLIEVGRFIDAGSPATILVLVTFLLGIAYFVRHHRLVAFAPAMAAPVLLLVVMFFVMPNVIYGTYLTAWRAGLAAALYGIAGLLPLVSVSQLHVRAVLRAVLVVVLVFTGWQSFIWTNTIRSRADYHALLTHVPVGAKIYWVFSGVEESWVEHHQIGIYHAACEAVIERKALVQSLFAYPHQQPLRYRDPVLRHLPGNSRMLISEIIKETGLNGIAIDSVLARFDYVIIYGDNAAQEAAFFPAGQFEFKARSGAFRLLQRAHSVPAEGPSS